MPCDLHVVFVEPEIHWNTGNAGRTCLAAGAQLHLVKPLGFSLDDRAVKRAGLDYWPRVNPRIWPDLSVFMASVQELGTAFYFSGAPGGRPLWDVHFPRPAVLVFGRESTGLPASLLQQQADRVVAIPMVADSVRSLNLSTAAGIALFEVLRQWRI